MYSLPLGAGQLQVLRRLQMKRNATRLTNRTAGKGSSCETVVSHQRMMISRKQFLQAVVTQKQLGLATHTLMQTLCFPALQRHWTHTDNSKQHGLDMWYLKHTLGIEDVIVISDVGRNIMSKHPHPLHFHASPHHHHRVTWVSWYFQERQRGLAHFSHTGD